MRVWLGKNGGALALLTAALSLTGCGFQTATSVCSVGALKTTQSRNSNFVLVPYTQDLSVYPGGTSQISVYVQPLNNATGTVTIAGQNLPPGVTVGPVTAAIGSTVSVPVAATNDVISQCFTGAMGVYTAATAVTLSGSSPSGSSTSQIALNVVLENPSFSPLSTNLPIMVINTEGSAPVDSEDNYVNASLSITDPVTPANNYTGTMEIKGHGNSTWNMPKKPYRLNLGSKAPLLGMASDTNWILLANYDDKSELRNDVSLEISKRFNMAWTPSSAFVELYLNGSYAGTYQLTEKVEVSKARLNIGSIDDTNNSGTDLTGGYLMEIDQSDGETIMFQSLVGLPIGFYDPDPPTTTQENYLLQQFTPAEASMYSPTFTDPTTGWRAYWDEDSLVNWFLIEELTGNVDADDASSDYFYKPRSDPKFYRGPVWDMDVTFGNTNEAGATIVSPSVPWVSERSLWYVQLLKDPAFLAAVKAQWTAIRPQMVTIPAYIDQRAAALTLAGQNDHSRWTTIGEKVWPNSEAAGSYQGEIDFMESWFNQRIAYMDSQYLQ